MSRSGALREDQCRPGRVDGVEGILAVAQRPSAPCGAERFVRSGDWDLVDCDESEADAGDVDAGPEAHRREYGGGVCGTCEGIIEGGGDLLENGADAVKDGIDSINDNVVKPTVNKAKAIARVSARVRWRGRADARRCSDRRPGIGVRGAACVARRVLRAAGPKTRGGGADVDAMLNDPRSAGTQLDATN